MSLGKGLAYASFVDGVSDPVIGVTNGGYLSCDSGL